MAGVQPQGLQVFIPSHGYSEHKAAERTLKSQIGRVERRFSITVSAPGSEESPRRKQMNVFSLIPRKNA